ncbi:beta-hexosaminidase subunit beta isoform X2 [Manduca sexta]|uniref:beta-hexosaminidase subunit beta isoform X2 n=1 Tax=Manduca sexta TaxID=7130 RepID=UPI0018904702|nr:beta-hexosaminidase subunit beta isoform X2 [Manduca sexta]
MDGYTPFRRRLGSELVVTNHTCDILKNALERYYNIWKKMHSTAKENNKWAKRKKRPKGDTYQGDATQLSVVLEGECEEYPHFDMDESYDLKVNKKSSLESASIWGILRGLESFTQLLYFGNYYTEIHINATKISDYPDYKHRGLLIDTGRHYLSLDNILKTIDALSMNKMNVLHWHIVDDQSFPYQSTRFPDLSDKGAFHPSLVYTPADVAQVIGYAAARGVRVVPEIDVPSHTRSWGIAYPQVLAKCYKKNTEIGLGPLNPISSTTYKLLRELFEEVQGVFPDSYFHIGGDEVSLGCWESNPNIKKYMNKHHMTITQLHSKFMLKALNILRNDTRAIVWQEVFDNGVPLSNDTLIQVWNYNWVREMVKILSAGHRVVFSSSWYLDYKNFHWNDYFKDDPRLMVYQKDPTLDLDKIVGGEVCLWGETADDTDVIMKVWPRTSAVAERLWTGLDYMNPPKEFVTTMDRRRIEEHVCRMRRRGIAAQPPNGPGFCIGAA